MPATAPDADPCDGQDRPTARARSVHRVPYLQNVGETSATVVWAGIPDGGQHVELARKNDTDHAVIATYAGVHPAPPSIAAAQAEELIDELHDDIDYDDDDTVDEIADEALEAEDYYELAARIDDLRPGVRYCYRLADDTGPLTGWASLTLAPKPDARRVDRFVVLGDTGTGHPAQLALARGITHVSMDAILFLGDNAYGSGTHGQIQRRFFDVYADTFRRVPVYAALGNHDVRASGGRPFLEAMVLPGNERWYSFDLGDVHFVVLDTTRIGREQAVWLERDLATRDRQYTVVLAHHPPYSSGKHGDSAKVRAWFVPIFERHHVDLVLSGHDHHYERRVARRGQPVYIVSGGGGAKLHDADGSETSARVAIVHHYLIVEAHADRLRVCAIDIEGNAFDEIDIPAKRRAATRRPALLLRRSSPCP